MKVRELVLANRSYRRFRQDIPVEEKTLRELVDLARLSPSAANLQPLKFILSVEPGRNAAIFPHLRWAGYLKDWDGPHEGERPVAYVIILLDTEISKIVGCDHGVAAQSIMLGAAELGLGGCMIGSIQRNNLRKALDINDRFEILLVLALGRPAEQVELEQMGTGGDIKYWRDDQEIHHVPKRSLDEIILMD